MKIRLVEKLSGANPKYWIIERKLMGLFWENYFEPFDEIFNDYDKAKKTYDEIVQDSKNEKTSRILKEDNI